MLLIVIHVQSSQEGNDNHHPICQLLTMTAFSSIFVRWRRASSADARRPKEVNATFETPNLPCVMTSCNEDSEEDKRGSGVPQLFIFRPSTQSIVQKLAQLSYTSLGLAKFRLRSSHHNTSLIKHTPHHYWVNTRSSNDSGVKFQIDPIIHTMKAFENVMIRRKLASFRAVFHMAREGL